MFGRSHICHSRQLPEARCFPATPRCSGHHLQGGVIEVGAPTGKWQLIVVYRGKHCPVSRNYLASLQQIIYELDDLGVEVLALTADGREKAEAFVSSCATLYLQTPGCAFNIRWLIALQTMTDCKTSAAHKSHGFALKLTAALGWLIFRFSQLV